MYDFDIPTIKGIMFMIGNENIDTNNFDFDKMNKSVNYGHYSPIDEKDGKKSTQVQVEFSNFAKENIGVEKSVPYLLSVVYSTKVYYDKDMSDDQVHDLFIKIYEVLFGYIRAEVRNILQSSGFPEINLKIADFK